MKDCFLAPNEVEAFDSYMAAAISGFTSTGMSTKTIQQHVADDAAALAYQCIEIRRDILRNSAYVDA
jgi:hypothetical protein